LELAQKGDADFKGMTIMGTVHFHDRKSIFRQFSPFGYIDK
jgi:hypothetical protein